MRGEEVEAVSVDSFSRSLANIYVEIQGLGESREGFLKVGERNTGEREKAKG